MKFRGHETFFIRKGWLTKGMKNMVNDPEVFITKEYNPSDVLGLGTNMVKSLRYWLQAFGLTTEPKHGRRRQTLTDFGKFVYEKDRYIQELGTLQLLHYKLCTNEDLATAWYYFFNEFGLLEFSREDFIRDIDNFLKMQNITVAVRSLEDDFNCIVNTYLPRYKMGYKFDPEANNDSPFGELGLLDIVDKKRKIYKKGSSAVDSFNQWVILAIIMDNNQDKKEEISLNDLLTGVGNIGKVFNLDSVTMLEILHNVEKSGVIKIVRTAGLDVIHINKIMTFDECVEKYYEEID